MSPSERANYFQGVGVGYICAGGLVWWGTSAVNVLIPGLLFLIGGLCYEVRIWRRKP